MVLPVPLPGGRVLCPRRSSFGKVCLLGTRDSKSSQRPVTQERDFTTSRGLLLPLGGAGREGPGPRPRPALRLSLTSDPCRMGRSVGGLSRTAPTGRWFKSAAQRARCRPSRHSSNPGTWSLLCCSPGDAGRGEAPPCWEPGRTGPQDEGPSCLGTRIVEGGGTGSQSESDVDPAPGSPGPPVFPSAVLRRLTGASGLGENELGRRPRGGAAGQGPVHPHSRHAGNGVLSGSLLLSTALADERACHLLSHF